jgi:GrpB-like predicted nucleotidyltransferase (UPF0157 family)
MKVDVTWEEILMRNSEQKTKFLKPEEYQPQALKLFDELEIKFRKLLPLAVIEHIGSSSIVGIISKGDLDIYVAVDSENFNEAILKIKTFGFQIKQKTLRTSDLCPFESFDFKIEVGIQLVKKGSKFEFFLEFRDRMNSDENLRFEYNKLKLESEGLSPSDYRKIKSQFIERTLEAKSPER